MRTIPPLALLGALLSGCAPAGPATRGGIVSLNPCSDQLLVALVPPERVAAISFYSQQPGASSIPIALARRFRATAGTAEEVIALAPDLVLADSFTAPATRAAFARAGLHTLYLGSPTTIEASKAQIAEVAGAVGAEARGRALVSEIDRSVAAARPTGAPVPTLLYLSGNLANGGGTLLDEEMRRAGLPNAAVDYGLSYTGRLSVEAIVARPPALILTPDGGGRIAALRRRVLATMGLAPREATFPHALINCGGPTIPAALARMAAIRRQVAG